MFKVILFDLDATLLNIDMDFFLKKYFSKMVTMAAEWGFKESKLLVEKVLKSTEVMINDLNPATSNEEVFMRDFLADGLFGPEDFAQAFFDHFYQVGFPQLSKYCQPMPGVPAMMEKLFAKGFRVVIATNAVFPLRALTYRIDWAGIGHFNYDLVTSYEIMHFCKPHPEYYLEIMDKIKAEPQDCLMIGNDMGEDLSAAKVGIKTFLVEDMLITKDVDIKPNWRGKWTDLFSFLEQL